MWLPEIRIFYLYLRSMKFWNFYWSHNGYIISPLQFYIIFIISTSHSLIPVGMIHTAIWLGFFVHHMLCKFYGMWHIIISFFLCLCQVNAETHGKSTNKNLCGTHDVSTCRFEMTASSLELMHQKSLPPWCIGLELNSVDDLNFCSCAVQYHRSLVERKT